MASGEARRAARPHAARRCTRPRIKGAMPAEVATRRCRSVDRQVRRKLSGRYKVECTADCEDMSTWRRFRADCRCARCVCDARLLPADCVRGGYRLGPLLRWLLAPIAGRFSGIRGAARGWRHPARSNAPCVPARGSASLAILGVSATIVLVVLLFRSDCRAARRLDAMSRRTLLLLVLLSGAPGCGRLCGLRHARRTRRWQPPLAYLISSSLAALKADFNRAADETRLIVLLAPTERVSAGVIRSRIGLSHAAGCARACVHGLAADLVSNRLRCAHNLCAKPRLSDRRVQQYRDWDHVLAKQMAADARLAAA